MNSNKNKFYIKIVVLNAIYIFLVKKFFIWSRLVSHNLILNFKFQNL